MSGRTTTLIFLGLALVSLYLQWLSYKREAKAS
jgi:uncharacterized membrane protein